jgi:hypothetical protein
MRNIILFTICSFLFLIYSCKSNEAQTTKSPFPPTSSENLTAFINKTQGKTVKDDSGLFLTLEKTACFGTCPIYSLLIFQDGTAIYEGRRFVSDSGSFKINFTPEQLNAIKAKAEEIKYFELEDKYDSPVTDFPTTITSIRIGNKIKIIQNRVAGPGELKSFESFVESMMKENKLEPLE